MKKSRKILSALLAAVMVVSGIPFAGIFAFAEDAPGGSSTSAATVIAFSDYQYENSDIYGIGGTGNTGGSILLNRILTASGVTSADGLLCCGDYDYDLNRSASDTAAGIASIKGVMNGVVAEEAMIFGQGNHDPASTDGGTAESGNNDPASGAYGVFLINERDYMWNSTGMNEQKVKETAEALRRYLNSKIAVGYRAPIFVMSHLPLHYSMRTNNDGDKQYANYIFDVLNEAGQYGLNIIYLYGHDHSNGWDDYLGGSKVYLAKGDSINIAQKSRTNYSTETLNFTYMNPGFMGYYENHNSASGTVNTYYDIADLTMTKFDISGADVTVTRYNVNGATDLKKAGVLNYYKSEQNKGYSADTRVVASSQTVTLTAVSDREHEIDAVVPVAVSSGAGGGTECYEAISSYTQLEAGSTYLIVATRNNAYYAAATQYTSDSSFSSARLEGVSVAASNGLSEGSLITDTSGSASGGGTLNLTYCEWLFNGNTFVPASGENQGKYIRIPNDNSASITFSTTPGTYTITDTFKEQGYLNLRSNCEYSSYTSGTSLTYFKKTVSSGAGETQPTTGFTEYSPRTSGQYVADGKYLIAGAAGNGNGCYLTSGTVTDGGLLASSNRNDALVVDIQCVNAPNNLYYVSYKNNNTTYYLNIGIGSTAEYLTWTTNPTQTAIVINSSFPGMIGLKHASQGYYADYYSSTKIGVWYDGMTNANERLKLYKENIANGTWILGETVTDTTTTYTTETFYTTVTSGSYSLEGGSSFLASNGTALTGSSSSLQNTNQPKWTVTKVSADLYDHHYTVKDSNNRYINISSSGVSLSGSPQNLVFTGNSDGTFKIGDGNGNYLSKNGNTVSRSNTGTDFTAYTWTSTETQTTQNVNETRYVLSSSVTANSKYVIANTNSATNNGHTLTKNGTSVSDTAAVIYAKDSYTTGVYIKNPSANAVWTAVASGTYFRFQNGSNYITFRNNVFGATTSTNNYRADWTVSNNATTVRNRGTNTQYLRYSSGWGVSNSNTNKVYFYKETTVSVPQTVTTTTYTYTRQNTSPTSYIQNVPHTATNTHDVYVKLAPHATFSVDNGISQEAVVQILKNGNNDNLPVSVYTADNANGTNSAPLDLVVNGNKISFDLGGINLSRAGVYNVPAYYTGENGNVEIGSVNIEVSSQKAISSVSLLSRTGTVFAGAGRTTNTGAMLHVEYEGGTSTNIPITVGMLIDYTGNMNAAAYAQTPGTYPGLGVFYDQLNGYWFSDFTLNVTQPDDYPEYPNEGSVKVGKTGKGLKFQTTGVAQVELTATGVPMNPGIDIVLMLDTSSSMGCSLAKYNSNGTEINIYYDENKAHAFYEDGTQITNYNASNVVANSEKTRLTVLKESVNELIDILATPNSTTGQIPDIQMAIADFAGYKEDRLGANGEWEQTDVNSYVSGSDYMLDGSARTGGSRHQVYTGNKTETYGAFVPITELASNFDIEVLPTNGSGTNYDKAFRTIYNIFKSREEYNTANQEDRQVIVMFMSDGAPFQYNGYTSNPENDYWNNWLQGTKTDFHAFVNPASGHAYFYNGTGNTNRMADALKGSKDETFTIFDLYSPDSTPEDFSDDEANGAYLKEISGLGAKMYTIGFCLTPDKNITIDSMDYVLRSCASEADDYFKAGSADQLAGSFREIASQVVQAGTKAYFLDTMGPAYDLQLKNSYVNDNTTYLFDDVLQNVVEPGVQVPEIIVSKNTVYTLADLNTPGSGLTLDDVGVRTGESTVLEKVTFSPDGTEAYSDQIDNGSTNILIGNVIKAKTFTYNNNKNTSIRIDRDGDGTEEFTLAAETFCWEIGIIADTEYSLSYYVYLTGSMEGLREAGSYATNTSATLYYTNYLGHDCHKDTVSPILPWEAATVNYEFYLVNADGQPVNNSGTVVPFENRTKIGLTQSKTILLNANSTGAAYTLRASAEIPEGYNLFNNGAEYTIYVGSGENPDHAVITDTAAILTTYYYEAGYKEKTNGTVSHVSDYGNTHVAFAVLYETSLIPDTVVVDFGLPVRVHALDNDIAISASAQINAIGPEVLAGTVLGNEPYAASRLENSGSSFENERYSAEVSGRNVVIQLKDMLLDVSSTFYYEVAVGSNYYYSKITVIPAENIYYEETFFTFTDPTAAVNGRLLAWEDAGEEFENVFQAEDRPGTFASVNDANNNYGYDGAYNTDTATYSMGHAKVATVTKGSFGKEPYATFTFNGTGFDLFSATTAECGCAWVQVTNENAEPKTTKTYIVDAYYGYGYGRVYQKEDGTLTLKESYIGENNEVIQNAPLYDCIDSKCMQPGITYHDVETGCPCETVSYLATNSTATHPVYSYEPTYYDTDGTITKTAKYYDEDGEITDEETETPAFAYAYAYAYGWISSEDASDAIYQVPVICVDGLEYSKYTVKIIPRYSAAFDQNNDDEFKFYVDSVRIYDPCGLADSIAENKNTVNKAYHDDNEANAQYFELRYNILNTDNFFSNGDDESTDYAIYIDGFDSLGRESTSSQTDAMNKYLEAGPNNETYLAQGQAIAFNMEVESISEPATIQIGAKIAKPGTNGNATGTLAVTNSESTDDPADRSGEYAILGCTAMYRDITQFFIWDSDYLEEHPGHYKTKYPIVIANTSDCVISLTNLKFTTGNNKFTDPNAEILNVMFSSSPAVKAFAMNALKQYTYIPPEEIDISSITAEWNSVDFEEGAEAVLSITTPATVEKLQIGDVVISEYETAANGNRVWKYKVIVTEDTEGSFYITFTDAYGRVTDSVKTEPLIISETEETTVVPEEETSVTANEETTAKAEETTVKTEESTVKPEIPSSEESEPDDEPESSSISRAVQFVKKLLTMVIGRLRALIGGWSIE